MSPVNQTPSSVAGRQYWRSLDDLADTEQFREFMHREFPAGSIEQLDGEGRRHFLKIMGASMAFAGLSLSGCRRWPEEQVAAYAKRPEDRIPGESYQYATCRNICGVASSLLVTSYDNRPIKVEGNPQSTQNQGASTQHDQSSILDLYDPDRSRAIKHLSGGSLAESSWSDFIVWARPHFQTIRNRGGRGLAVISEATGSPSEQSMRNRLEAECSDSLWCTWEPVNDDTIVEGVRAAFGAPHRPVLSLGGAKVIVSLDANLLDSSPAGLTHARGYADSRRSVDDGGHPMSRMYSFEPVLTLTGANADDRQAVAAADICAVVAHIAARVTGAAVPTELADGVSLSADVMATIDHAVADLQAHRGESVVAAGPSQPAKVHALVALINETLGNTGRTVSYLPLEDYDAAHRNSLAEVVAALNAGTIDTLVILGGNPAYNAPADLNFASAMSKATSIVRLGDYEDETTNNDGGVTWYINRAHYLESWGDGRTADGTIVLGQPLIEPLFGGRSCVELLAVLVGDDLATGYDIVRRTYRDMRASSDFESHWRQSLHDGIVAGSTPTLVAGRVRGGVASSAMRSLASWRSSLSTGGYEVVFHADDAVFDGRYANNGWLQELADPITKLTWDNALLMGTEVAEQLGISTQDLVTVAAGNQSRRLPAVVVPGMATRSVAVKLGYGRTLNATNGEPARIATDAGDDVYPLRSSESLGFRTDGNVSAAGGSKTLAITQDHHAVNSIGGKGLADRMPTLIREEELGHYKSDPKFAKHRAHVPHRLSLFDEDNLSGAHYRWGMSIDLNACIGCSACVVACQAENNIPIVGKEQVSKSREMHWLRIDRYFKFAVDEVDSHGSPSKFNKHKLTGVAVQPVMCVMCENAPCEQVCPVAATVHDEQGLNVMVYNRCIGTRYCSNNCPYKVRRFNYFDYWRRPAFRKQPGTLLQVDPGYYAREQAAATPLEQMQLNPEVTVRVRGVMEKCTYCVQRIQQAKIKTKNSFVNLSEEARQQTELRVPDGEIKTACQQACAAGAIVFGDLADSRSAVSKLHKSNRAYEMLEELNTKPRTRYLARIWNPSIEGSRVAAFERGHHATDDHGDESSHEGNGTSAEGDAH